MRRALFLLVLLAPAPALPEPLRGPHLLVPHRIQLQGMQPHGAIGRFTPRTSGSALAEARRYLCPNGGRPQGRGRCAPAAGGGSLASENSDVRGWDQGIPPPNRAQAPCPPGTVTAQARDNPGVTRCVAG